MIANARTAHSLTALALSLVSGCTFLIESDKKDCTKDTQCVEPYVCGSKNVCEVQTGCSAEQPCRGEAVCIEGTCKLPDCKVSADDCPANEVCNVALGTCVPVGMASCETSEDCATYEGAQTCITREKLCRAPECSKSEQCVEQSPTAECSKGECVDPIWGCLGVSDPRKAQDSSTEASLKIKILYAFAQDGAKETGVKDIDVRVCQFPDQQCQNLATEDWTYTEDNYLWIKGLESGLNYRIQIQATNPAKSKLGQPLLPAEYLMYRTVVGETTEPKPILMFEDAVRDMLASLAEVNVDEELGLLLMRIYDCQDVEVAGVQVSAGNPTTGCGGDCPTTVFYQNTNNLPDPSATQTNSAGRAGIVNLKPLVLNRVTLTRAADNEKITSFVVTPRANWITYVHIWPWDYGTAVD